MRINRRALEDAIERGTLTQRTWDEDTPCLMSAIAGRSIDECASAGWPRWLAEVGVYLFDQQAEENIIPFALEFTEAAEAAEAREADYDEVYKEFRLGSVLPIALEAVGEGDEEWRVKCRAVVQWSIDHGGIANPDAKEAAMGAAAAASAAGPAGANCADAAYAAVDAACAAGGGVGAGYTAAAVSVSDDHARDSAIQRMQDSLLQSLRGKSHENR